MTMEICKRETWGNNRMISPVLFTCLARLILNDLQQSRLLQKLLHMALCQWLAVTQQNRLLTSARSNNSWTSLSFWCQYSIQQSTLSYICFETVSEYFILSPCPCIHCSCCSSCFIHIVGDNNPSDMLTKYRKLYSHILEIFF
jgi:hypothetical protein